MPSACSCRLSIGGNLRRHSASSISAGIIKQRRRTQSVPLGEWRKDQRPERETQRPAGDVERHRERRARPCPGDARARRPAGERPRRRDRRRPGSQPSIQGVVASPIKRQDAERDESGLPASSTRGRQRSATWPKPSCGDGVRHQEAHLNRARSRKRQVQVRNEQRQQWRVDVAETVDQKVRAGQQQRRWGEGRTGDLSSWTTAEPSGRQAPHPRGTREYARPTRLRPERPARRRSRFAKRRTRMANPVAWNSRSQYFVCADGGGAHQGRCDGDANQGASTRASCEPIESPAQHDEAA